MYNRILEKNQIVKATAATLRLYLLLLVQKVFSFIVIFNDRLTYTIIPFIRTISKSLVACGIVLLSFNSCYAEDYTAKIRLAEIKYGIPKGLLLSIAKIESQMHPWTLNSYKGSLYANTKEEAIKELEYLISEGVTNVDIGIIQLNLKWHKKNFAEIHEMLDPDKNIEYAARLLSKLYAKHKKWYLATAHYHSYNPVYYKKYYRKVLVTWLES